jgi:hypothetical protein
LFFRPDWVSLQYVPYSFGKHGIPFLFTTLAFYLHGPWRFHIMFHELWIDGRSSLKAAATSKLQKFLIYCIVQILKPQVVCTSIHHYVQMLSFIGISSVLFPIFSNIQVLPRRQPDLFPKQSWIFVFFGSFDHQWSHEPLFNLIEEARRASNLSHCLFVKIGRTNSNQTALWKAISNDNIRNLYPRFIFDDIGEKSEEDVSDWLLRASFGISMAPLQWIGKSSSVAAMVDHGLPIIVPTYQVAIPQPPMNEFSFAHQIIPINHQLPKRLRQAHKYEISDSAQRCAFQLLDLLSA